MPTVSQLASGRYRVQWRDAAGRKRSAGRSFPNETMARTYGLDREAEVRRGEDRDPNAGRILLKDWIGEYSVHRVAEPRTLAKIQSHLDRYVLKGVGGADPLGDMRLDQVNELVLQAWVKRMQDLKLAPSTVTGIYVTLASILRGAVRLERIRKDPTGSVILPTIPPPDDFYWERGEIAKLRTEMRGVQDLALFELLIGTGVRWGEAVGLHRPRWQPDRHRLSVVEVIGEDHGFALKQYPKGKRRREVPAVAPELLDAMTAHVAASPPVDCGLSHGRGKRCPGLVFHDNGRPLSRHGWPRLVLDPAIVAAGVRRGTAHDLRHTYASWLVLDGVPLRVVQELLGHASIRTTERYSHLAPETLDDPRLIASLTGRTAEIRADMTAAAREHGA